MRAELIEKRYDREFLKQHDLRVHHLITDITGVRDPATFLLMGMLVSLRVDRAERNFGKGAVQGVLNLSGLKRHGGLVATFVSVPAKALDLTLPDEVFAYSGIIAHPGEQVSRSTGRLLAFAEMQAGNYRLLSTVSRDSTRTFAGLVKDGLGNYPERLREEIHYRILSCRDRPDDNRVS